MGMKMIWLENGNDCVQSLFLGVVGPYDLYGNID